MPAIPMLRSATPAREYVRAGCALSDGAVSALKTSKSQTACDHGWCGGSNEKQSAGLLPGRRAKKLEQENSFSTRGRVGLPGKAPRRAAALHSFPQEIEQG